MPAHHKWTSMLRRYIRAAEEWNRSSLEKVGF